MGKNSIFYRTLINLCLLAAFYLISACSNNIDLSPSSTVFQSDEPSNTQEPPSGELTTPSAILLEVKETSSSTEIIDVVSTIQPSVTPTELIPAYVTRIPDPREYEWKIIADGFTQPVGLSSPMDSSARLFVIEQQGLIYIVQKGEVQPEPFLDLRDRVSMLGATTRGLLGLAFHPNFALNGYLYVDYTNDIGEITVSQFSVSQEPNIGDPGSEMILLTIMPPIGEHNGGDLAFGPDGYLYIAVGDGGGGGYHDQEGNAQNKDSLLGKILRIDVGEGDHYLIPDDNPFVVGGGRPEVWAYGLRNPWRFTFDLLTGDLYIADVGENLWEEVNFLEAGGVGGSNFGWNYFEGSNKFREDAPINLDYVDPVIEYSHTQGCSVTGGKVYRGGSLPEWNGVYFYGDFCQGKIWGLLRELDGDWNQELLYELSAFITSFGQDEAGEIYLVDLTGKIYQLARIP